ncbi:MAG: hypothetical protein JJE04_24730 [Acidobacteriia bacterium]|nr:hypothetical protein [Terriglobia bacterium]
MFIGGGWTEPGTVRLEGGSFGLQIGGGENAQKLVKSKFTLGGSAGAMLGR